MFITDTFTKKGQIVPHQTVVMSHHLWFNQYEEKIPRLVNRESAYKMFCPHLLNHNLRTKKNKIISIAKSSQKEMILIKRYLEARLIRLIRIFLKIMTIIVNEKFYILIVMMKCFLKAKFQTLIQPMMGMESIKITLESY
jgi:hypothetical protein